jgi:hypothetical protein
MKCPSLHGLIGHLNTFNGVHNMQYILTATVYIVLAIGFAYPMIGAGLKVWDCWVNAGQRAPSALDDGLEGAIASIAALADDLEPVLEPVDDLLVIRGEVAIAIPTVKQIKTLALLEGMKGANLWKQPRAIAWYRDQYQEVYAI